VQPPSFSLYTSSCSVLPSHTKQLQSTLPAASCLAAQPPLFQSTSQPPAAALLWPCSPCFLPLLGNYIN
jgi:hypothetical protein